MGAPLATPERARKGQRPLFERASLQAEAEAEAVAAAGGGARAGVTKNKGGHVSSVLWW